MRTRIDELARQAFRFLSEPQDEAYRAAWMRVTDLIEGDPSTGLSVLLEMIRLSKTADELSYITSEVLLHFLFASELGIVQQVVTAAENDDRLCTALRAVVRYEKKILELERCIIPSKNRQEPSSRYMSTLDMLVGVASRCRSMLPDIHVASQSRIASAPAPLRQDSQADTVLVARIARSDPDALRDLDELRLEDPHAAWQTLMSVIENETVADQTKRRIAEIAWRLLASHEDDLLPAVITHLSQNSFRDWLQFLTFDGFSEVFVDGVLTAIQTTMHSSSTRDDD